MMLVVEVNRISSRSEFPARNTFLAEEDVSTDFVELDSACLGVEKEAMIYTFTKDVNRSQNRCT
jgi:hypothetical protein